VPVSDSIQRLIATVNPGPEKNISWLKFNADSILNRLSTKDSTEEKYYLRDSVLYIFELNDYAPYHVRTMTDTLVEFMNRDSVVFVLKKH
jgi:hypothetical protein